MRQLSIQESSEHEIDVTRDEAAALNDLGTQFASQARWWGDSEEDDHERSVIRCYPGLPGGWRIRVDNAIGLIAVGEVQIAVGPKIPVGHVLYLLEQAGLLPRSEGDRAEATPGESFWGLVARWFTGRMEALLRADLVRDYSEQEEELSVVRGRLQAVGTARNYYRGILRFPCEFEEFDIDTPLNRVLRAATMRVVASELLEWNLRKRASRVLARMEGVGDVRASDQRASLERRTAHYGDAWTLARHVLGGVGRSLGHGDATAWGFLMRTPEDVEEGVRRSLAARIGGRWAVEKRPTAIPGSTLTFNPDLVFADGWAVGDVKYKLGGPKWQRADLYQAISFAEAERSRFAAIIDFARSVNPDSYRLRVGEVEIQRFSWAAADEMPPDAAADRLASEVAEWLESTGRRSA